MEGPAIAKRIIDIAGAVLMLALAGPFLAIAALAICLRDGGSPIYRAPRVGRDGRDFTMFKLRTMVLGADRLGGRLAPDSDPRVTPLGAWLRRWKIDELPQFWNVLRGDMSIVGPRPDVRHGGVDGYSPEEMRVLSLRPGITDFASILFFDEGRLLDRVADPGSFYLAAIRPIKSRLALFYVDRRSLWADLTILALTGLAFVARPLALRFAGRALRALGARGDLVEIYASDIQPAILGISLAARG